MTPKIESAILFTPGRASYRTQANPEAPFELHLTQASERRATVASQLFVANPHFYERAVFAGGTPAVSEGWRDDQIPPDDQREAYFMARPLKRRLREMDWPEEQINQTVLTQGDSNNSIGDVRLSIERGLIDRDELDRNRRLGIRVVAGAAHSIRFREIFGKALDINPDRITRVRMCDIYGRPATQFHPGESRQKAISKEFAGIALTRLALSRVRPGNLDDLRDAEERLNRWVSSAHHK